MGLGMRTKKVQRMLLILSSLVTGAAVAVSGTIGFVGLIVPHVIRRVIGPDHRILLPASFMAGASFLVGADLLARSLMSPEELPLGTITSLVGAPFFLYLLQRHLEHGAHRTPSPASPDRDRHAEEPFVQTPPLHHTEELVLDRVTFARHDRTILDHIQLQIGKGELVGLIGPNGAGKSTLLRLAMKVWAPTGGAVFLEGTDLLSLSQKDVARRVALLPQNPSLEHPFIGRDVVLMGRYPHLGRFERESSRDHELVDRAMARTHTTAFAGRLVTELSGGERQRLLLARTLAQEAACLLLDEPTANLDLHHQLGIMDLVASLATQGVAVLMALHDLNVAARYCHRLVLLHQGRIVAMGRPEEVLTPERLKLAYGIEVEVSLHPRTGRLLVVPLA